MKRENRVPGLLAGLGTVFLLAMAGEGLYVLFVSNPLGEVWVAGLVTSLPFAVGLVYAGYWLPDSSISVGRYTRVAYWCAGGLSVFLAINITIMVTMPPASGLQLVSWGRWATSIGAGVGLLVGTFEAHGIERAVEAERERIRAEEAETKEEFLAYLNATLRHEVLNTASVIVGNAELVSAEYDGGGSIPDRMESIKRHVQGMEDVIEDVRVLLQAFRDGSDAEPIDITDMLTEEIDSVRNASRPVVVETSMPERAIAIADRPLRRAFANLLRNAVEHNDSEIPRIEVTITPKPETVVVRIADNGPGISDAERETLFDQEVRYDSNHGLGLALTETLVENYDGAIELTETGPEGTVFTITLPRHSNRPHDGAVSDPEPISGPSE